MASDEGVFRAQFDPTHPSYHNGDPSPVPLGGARVPPSCAAAVESPHSTSVLSSPASELRELVGGLRQAVGDLKTAVSAVNAAVAAGVSSPPPDREAIEAAIGTAERVLAVYKNRLAAFRPDLREELSLTSSVPEDVVEEVRRELCGEDGLFLQKTSVCTKETYGSLILTGHAWTRKLFAEMTRLLKIMKEVA